MQIPHVSRRATNHLGRARWAAVGAAVAISVGALTGPNLPFVDATIDDPSAEKPVYVPIEPCRLLDTRPDFQIGERSTPLGTDPLDVTATGSEGDCTIPATATGISANATAVGASLPTNVRFYPAGGAVPNVSHLNPVPGEPPAPNAVNIDLDGSGRFTVKNAFGAVDLIVDVVGYYEDHAHDEYVRRPDQVIVAGLDWQPVENESDWSYGGGWVKVNGPDDDCLHVDLDLPEGTVATSMAIHSPWTVAAVTLAVLVERSAATPDATSTGNGAVFAGFRPHPAASPGGFVTETFQLDETVESGYVYRIQLCTPSAWRLGSVVVDVEVP